MALYGARTLEFLINKRLFNLFSTRITIPIMSRGVQTNNASRKGLVLGMYTSEGDEIKLTKTARTFQNERISQLSEFITMSGLSEKKGQARVFYGADSEFPCIAVVSLGKEGVGINTAEDLDESKENVRLGVAAGVKQLHEAGVLNIMVDPCGEPEAAAEGAKLSVFSYNELKSEKNRKQIPELQVFANYSDDPFSIQTSWESGSIFAEAQNLSRRLMEAPANFLTPTEFAKIAVELQQKMDKIEVHVRDKEWVLTKGMNSFLSVSAGSHEPLRLVEVHYTGGTPGEAPLAVVGKGITFDSGGISLKPAANMDKMRADMGGAACTLASIVAACKLNVPLNIVGIIPLCENMPGGGATKPGDVVKAMNGKTIQIDNTDAEGRLILADALCYAETFQPRAIIDMATLTGAMVVALGSAAAGVFTNSDYLWDHLYKAGVHSGDRLWRLPLYRHYSKKMTESQLADLNNIGSGGRAAGSCTAAAFLKEFVTNQHWAHIDIAGVMESEGELAYLKKGMAGRPTRTIVEFFKLIANAKD